MTSGLVRRRIIVLIVLVIVAAVGLSLLFTGTTAAATTFDGGNGTVDDPYEIANWTQLNAVSDDPDAHYVLVDDLTQNTDGYANFSSTTANGGDGWNPIGPKFTGTFDGQGHTIDGLYIDRASTSEIGLFEIIGSGGEVRNLRVTNVNLTGAGLTGGLAGRNDGLIENSSTTGVVEGRGDRTGGLVGINKAGPITNSYSGAEVISDAAEIGGLAGKNANIIKKSYSFGVVDSADTGTDVGGLIGKDEGTTDDSFWDTNTSGQPTSAGGTGKTTSEMQDVATFTDTATTGLSNPWDFVDNPNDDTGTEDIWNIAGSINDGYPHLIVDLQAAETGDANGDGTVDEITVTFTESVADSSVHTGGFSLSTGSVDSVSTGTTTDDDTVVLTVSGLSTGDTSGTPDVTLSASSVTDLAGNTGPSTNTTVTASDGASPVMLSAVTGDVDGDGHLDRVNVTYSEGVTAASTNITDYNIGGASYSGESIVTDDDGDATLVFNMTELGTFDTGATPDVAYAQGTTADTGGNRMASQTINDTTDGAAPVLVSTAPTDNATGVNTGTNLDATFSESVVNGSGNVEIRQSANDTVFETIGITNSSKVSISGEVVTIDPDGALSGNTGYYVLINGTAIDDTSSNSFGGISGNTTWNFETADTTAPSVTVDQPNGGERLAGGSLYDIQWNATDNDSVAANGIDLAYSTDSGTTWTTIATGETNNGTYNWTVPMNDSETVMVRVSANDTSGNVARDVSDSVFTIDSTAPDLLAAETDDTNANGTVDQLVLTFTEPINDSSVTAADFTLSTGSVDSTTTGTTSNDSTVVLGVSGHTPDDTAVTPSVTVTNGSTIDLAGNAGPDTDTPVTATDGARPVIVGATTADGDGNGHLDRVNVTYSEGVTTAGTAVGDYDIGGATYEGESIVTDDDGDATLAFGVTELGTSDTGATPDVAYAQGTTTDTAGNPALSQTVTATDGAAPIANSPTLGTTTISDSETGDGNEVTVSVTFGEAMSQTPSDATVIADANGDLSTAPTIENKRWSDAQTFKTDLQFTDDGESVSGVSLNVDGTKDTAGNVMGSAVSTTYDVETTNPSSGSSGGGTVSTEFIINEQDTESTSEGGTMQVTIQRYEIGDTLSVPTENVGTDSLRVEDVSVSFNLGTNVQNEMSIQSGSEPPENVPAYSETEDVDYVSVNIEGNLADRVESGSITVSLAEDRIPDDASEVTAHHYKNGEWEPVETTHLEGQRFKIHTSDYSTFAIVMQQEEAETTTTQPTTATTTTTEVETTNETTEEPGTDDEMTTTGPASTTTPPEAETETPVFEFVVGIIVVMGTALLIYRKRRN